MYIWVDIFAIWQSVVDAPAVAREKSGDLAGLGEVIATARTTVLMWHAWDAPTVVRRSWCWCVFFIYFLFFRGVNESDDAAWSPCH